MQSNEADRLIDRYGRDYMEKVFYFCLRRTGDVYEAQDLTSDISLCILSALRGGVIPSHFSGWVWQIARNRYCRWVERQKKKLDLDAGADVEAFEIGDSSPEPPDLLIRQEEIAALRRELAFIASDYRNLVVAYYIEDRSIKEIAASMNLPEGTVVSRLFRARKLLKEGMNMAKEFGILSYKPENIRFEKWGSDGAFGEPWTLIDRKLAKNLILAAYRNPSTAEDLALELGVALPYLEDELEKLTEATLIHKSGKRYESGVMILGADAANRIEEDLDRIAPKLTDSLIALLDRWLAAQAQGGGVWQEGSQPVEDVKWALLMRATDELDIRASAEYHRRNPACPSEKMGGRTPRPNGGAWDLIGFEEGNRRLEIPVVGHHTAAGSDEFPGFGMYRFGYRSICDESLGYLSHAEGDTLLALVKGEGKADPESLKSLTQQGFLTRTSGGYLPNFWLLDRSRLAALTQTQSEEIAAYAQTGVDLILTHDLFRRGVVMAEMPEFMKADESAVEFACIAAFGNLRGRIVQEALNRGWLTYTEGADHRMLGVYMEI